MNISRFAAPAAMLALLALPMVPAMAQQSESSSGSPAPRSGPAVSASQGAIDGSGAAKVGSPNIRTHVRHRHHHSNTTMPASTPKTPS